MLTENVHPSSLEGIKSLASEIKKAQGKTHTTALDFAAKRAGYSNFTHARRSLSGSQQPLIYLTVYWRDPMTDLGGRETLPVRLPIDLNAVLTKDEIRCLRGMEWFRRVNDDHFVVDILLEARESARAMACKAARSLQFLAYSGLKPTKHHRKLRAFIDLIETFPETDHTTAWFDPVSGNNLFVNEPYEERSELLSQERLAWCKNTGWQIVQIEWEGMYFPNNCNIMLVGSGTLGNRLHEIANKISFAPKPYYEENWVGQSVGSLEAFLSPRTARTLANLRRSKAKGTVIRMQSRATTPYGSKSSGARRPNGRLSLINHVDLGARLKAVIANNPRAQFSRNKLEMIRCELENWMFCEQKGSDIDEVGGFRVYYGAADSAPVNGRQNLSFGEMLSHIAKVRNILAKGYPDCAPLRSMLSKLDATSKALSAALH